MKTVRLGGRRRLVHVYTVNVLQPILLIFLTVMGLQLESYPVMVKVMERDIGRNGIRKCRKFTGLVNFNETMRVISAALAGHYCVLHPFPNQDSTNTAVGGPLRGTGMLRYSLLALFTIVSLSACSAGPAVAVKAQDQAAADQPQTVEKAPWRGQTGTASYYGKPHHGRRTASGVRFDQMAMTAAHPWLPFGTRVRVTVEGTDRSVVVVINDRLPSRTRVMDLSLGAAQQLGIIRQGLARVSIVPV